MSLDDAKYFIVQGVMFGDVFPLMKLADQEPLKRWFVSEASVPNLKSRNPVAYSGDACRKCGGPMVFTGSCRTCQWCAETGGCG